MKATLPLLFLAASTTLSLAAPSFTAWSYTEKDIYPSAIVSTATVDWNGDTQQAEDRKTKDDPGPAKHELPLYGDENGWIGVELTGVKKGTSVEVMVSIDGFMKPSKWKGVVTKVTRAGEARIFPKAVWDYTALLKIRQQRPVNATFQVKVNGEELPEEIGTFQLKSLNDCPFYVLWDEEGEDFDDFSWLFAAYVNENHPQVDRILKEALATGLVDSFTGYQSGETEQVTLQVFAIWNALQRRGIQYSDVSTTTPSDAVVGQSVRFLDESINSSQANCVDGSVLLASVLRKIGIDAYLVMVPGHCLLAFAESKDDDAELVGLETTMLGQNQLTPLKDAAKQSQKTLEREFQVSLKTFQKAIKAGNAALEKNADEFESGEDPNTQLISISDARELGIMPLPYTKGR
ncbi:MAG: hypothetical protein ACO1TE_27360 [Prosthecobacter sp.]